MPQIRQISLISFLVFLLPAFAYAGILQVGLDKPFKSIRTAAAAVKDGDIVEVDRGIYRRDVATWRANNITVRTIGGRAHLRADGANESGKGIWVVRGRDVVIEGFEFSGASVPDKNGAGIRIETQGKLTIRNCYFHNNENGILGPNNPEAEVMVENSLFEKNGYGDGYSHNIYIGRIRRFTLRGSYSHLAHVGHNVKSRARQNFILYNRIMDEDTGNASFQIDLPEGGISFILGNIIQQGPRAENVTIITYAAENTNAGRLELHVINNTIVNDRPNGGTFLKIRAGTIATVANNILYGPGTAVAEEAIVLKAFNNYREPARNNSPRMKNPEKFDYRISQNSPCVNKGALPGTAHGLDLTPRQQYKYDVQSEMRTNVGILDIGAFEASDAE